MNIVFPSVDEHYIKAKVADGYYSNATELVRDAVRRLREHDDRHYARLIAALEVGEQAIRNGDYDEYTPQLLEEIASQAREDAVDGKKPDSDVCF